MNDLTFHIFSDYRTVDLFDDWTSNKIERHDFLNKLELIKDGHKQIGLKVLTEEDPHAETLGCGAV